MKLICPCQGCGDRLVGCHSTCIAYMKWKTDREDQLKPQKEAEFIQRAFIAHGLDLKRRLRRM